MFLFLRNTKPRKTDRNRSSRYRAKLKAKNKARRGRIYCAGRALGATAQERGRGPPGLVLFCFCPRPATWLHDHEAGASAQ